MRKDQSKERFQLLRIVHAAFKHKPVHTIILVLLSTLKGLIPAAIVIVIAEIALQITEENGIESNRFLLVFILFIALNVISELLAYTEDLVSTHIRFSFEVVMQKGLMQKAQKVHFRTRELSEYADKLYRAFEALEPWRVINTLNVFPRVFSGLITVVSLIVVLGSVNWALPLVNLVVMVACMRTLKKSNKQFFDAIRRSSREERMLSAFTGALRSEDTLAELKVYKRFDWLLDKWASFNIQFRKMRRKDLYRRDLFKELTAFVMHYAIPCFSAFIVLWLSSELSVQIVILSLQSATLLTNQVHMLVEYYGSFVENRELFTDYFRYMELPDENREESMRVKPTSSEVALECSDLSFSYDGQKNVLSHINLEIKHGEKIVVVGENGSGKTTLAKLLLRLYKPSQGEIRMNDGFRNASVVFQDFVRYLITLRFNVGAGELKKIDDTPRIINTLRKLDFTEHLEHLDEQLGMQFGGKNFSVGQWQKIAIARASYKEGHQFVVLDEPTASIDPVAETQIISDYLKTYKEKTCVFISHRLSSIRLADRIVVMGDGKITECGTHDELMCKKGTYYEMFSSQANLYG